MKKIFALALAALMTAGMTTVAFADLGMDSVSRRMLMAVQICISVN
ncbi:MAG: hypothetical protein V8Q30_08680 [Acutalibacteraceae bacterium]